MTSADSISLGEMARGFFRGKLLCAAVRLGIADALGDAEKSVDELARRTSTDPGSLHRLLRALAGIGIVEETSSARFRLTPMGRPLRKDVADSVWASIIFWADLLADSWTYLADCVRAGSLTGAAAAMERAGTKSRWSQEPDAVAIFHAVFAEAGPAANKAFVEAHDFSGYKLVADLGGAGGGLIAAILQANPQGRGLLVDRQEAVAGASPRLREFGVADRCELLAADLLQTVPPGADAFILRSVLHGYDDARARQILENCLAASKPDTMVLIIEAVLPTTVRAGDPALEKMLMGDINMLAVTGGRERSEAEWSNLMSSAGYEICRITPVAGQTSSIIESTPRR